MIPLNVTHLAILNNSQHASMKGHDPAVTATSTPKDLVPMSPFRSMMSTMLSFFADAYKSTFGFTQGPPLHDPLTVAYVSNPEIFKTARYRVDIDCSYGYGVGQTIVDVWNYRECDKSWGRNGKNVLVAEDVDVSYSYAQFSCICSCVVGQVDAFFKIFLDCVSKCDQVTPLNK